MTRPDPTDQPATPAGRYLLNDLHLGEQEAGELPRGRINVAEHDCFYLRDILAIEREAAAPLRAALERIIEAWDNVTISGVRVDMPQAIHEARAALAERPTETHPFVDSPYGPDRCRDCDHPRLWHVAEPPTGGTDHE